ncbi:MAG: agmatinase family protein [Weeksellaceae bacterium]|jgi:agmatinase|nr:agmatinase family protein [Weeksellaceae bacterium]MDX9705565.1 agmatinase family protein [Weeksellaceae bacterium]
MSKQEIIDSFDPNQPGLSDANLYGLPFSSEQSDILIVPAPWEVTVSYGAGASEGIEAIFNASFQVDLFHQEFPELWKSGIFMTEDIPDWKSKSDELKKLALPIIEALEKGENPDDFPELKSNLNTINSESEKFKTELRELILSWQKKGKIVALLGGDHSTPLGFYEALAQNHSDFGILHLDAHMDLREAYEGFNYSHASIMNNALKIPQISKIVQVGIRDFCEQEVEIAKNTKNRVKIFTDSDLKKNRFEGKTWKEQCDFIIQELPEKVHISFDIDALQQSYCPNTGTPVPGGLSFEEATYLLSALANSGKKIIGFDLVEVAPGEDDWDGNVGARILFHLCGVLAKSNDLTVGERVQF